MKARTSCGLTFPPTRSALVQASVLALCGLLSLNALAFNSYLQPEEVEKAYSLGKTSNHEDLSDFLNQYEHDFKVPADDSIAYVSSVEFQTPYEQIVLRSLKTVQYSKFQAQEDYQANPNLVNVRVVVALKTGYSGPEPPADSFKAVVSQARPIEPRDVTSTVLCNPLYTNVYSDQIQTNGDCLAYSKEILLKFDAKQFAPGRATVKITLPSGKSMQTTYNLDNLK
jgi:hypothetical protein